MKQKPIPKRRQAKDTTPDGEIRGVKTEGSASTGRSKEQIAEAQRIKQGIARRRTEAEERELESDRRRRRARRGR